MPLLTVENVKCPECQELFDIDDVDPENPDFECDCPFCHQDFNATFVPLTKSIAFEALEDPEPDDDEDDEFDDPD